MWGLKEGESEDTGEEEIGLRPDVVLAWSSRRVISVDFPLYVSPVKVHSEASVGAVQGPISSGEFGLWRGFSSGSLPKARAWFGERPRDCFPEEYGKIYGWGLRRSRNPQPPFKQGFV